MTNTMTVNYKHIYNYRYFNMVGLVIQQKKKPNELKLVNTLEYLYCQIIRNSGLMHPVLYLLYIVNVSKFRLEWNSKFHKSFCCHLCHKPQNWSIHEGTIVHLESEYIFLNTSYMYCLLLYWFILVRNLYKGIVLCLTSDFFYVFFTTRQLTNKFTFKIFFSLEAFTEVLTLNRHILIKNLF